MTQTQWVKHQLKRGRSLTALDALRGCGCLRLAARVLELKQSGLRIKSKRVARGEKHCAEYSL